MTIKITNIVDLTNDLATMYESLRNKTMEHKEAKEINNTAGKIISTVKVQIDYAGLCGVTPDIDFLKKK